MSKNNLPSLSPEALGVLSGLGFRPLPGISHTFMGKAVSQNEDQDPYIVIMQILPLKIDTSRYVVSLTYNGQEAFKARLGTLDDVQDWFKTYAVFNDIEAFVRSQVS